jgi:hypothetical protein
MDNGTASSGPLPIKDKLKLSLDELRILILGAEVILGFHMRTWFTDGYEDFPRLFQDLDFTALAFTVATIMLLMAPCTAHRIRARGKASEEIVAMSTRAFCVALLTMSLALAMDFYIAVGRLAPGAAVGGSLALLVMTALCWLAIPKLANEKPPEVSVKDKEESLKDRIDQVLTESRVILPGVQALLGFSFTTVFQKSFMKQPGDVHAAFLFGLVCLCVTILALMTPAAYHRIALGGELSERLEILAGGCNLVGAFFLALAVGSDMYIAARRLTELTSAAWLAGLLTTAALLTAWFVLPWIGRKKTASS